MCVVDGGGDSVRECQRLHLGREQSLCVCLECVVPRMLTTHDPAGVTRVGSVTDRVKVQFL